MKSITGKTGLSYLTVIVVFVSLVTIQHGYGFQRGLTNVGVSFILWNFMGAHARSTMLRGRGSLNFNGKLGFTAKFGGEYGKETKTHKQMGDDFIDETTTWRVYGEVSPYAEIGFSADMDF